MRKNKLWAIVFSVFILLSCNGGGGGGSSGIGPPPVLYDGLSTPSAVTASNAMPFVNLIFGASLTPPEINVDGVSASAMSVARAETVKSLALAATTVSRIPVSGTEPGLGSGTMSYSGNINPDLTGSITFTFTNFNDGDGYTFDGKLILNILAVDPFSLEFTHAQYIFWLLTVASDSEHFTLSGTLESFYEQSTTTMTDIYDMDGNNILTDATFRYENFNITTSCDTIYSPTYCSQDITGRIYLASDGYVDLTTTTPVEFNYIGQFNVDVPDTGGPLNILGDQGTGLRITPLSITEVQVDVNIDADPNYEYSDVYKWSELVGIIYTFEKTYGTSENFEVALSAQETSDGGYIAAGWANTGVPNYNDVMILKTDAAGREIWTQYLGGTNDDYAQTIRETSDGGFIIGGYSTDFPTSGFIYKVDSDGNETWNRPLSSSPESMIFDVQQTSDGGYIATGLRRSSPTVGLGYEDVYLVKLDANGNVTWETILGSGNIDIGRAVIEVSGGGFVIVGQTEIDNGTNQEVYVVRTDAAGNPTWETSFGGTYTQFGYDILETGTDFVVSGNSYTDSGYVYTLHKLNASGTILWSSSFGSTTNYMTRNSITLSGDGGYVMAATDTFDVQMFKLDGSGTLGWEKQFNWSPFLVQCTATSVEKTLDGGYIIGGSAWPSSGKDFYLIKTDSAGNL